MNDSLRVALVTGAGSGIGRAVCHALFDDGYVVALAGRRLEALQETVSVAGVDETRALCVPTDVGKPGTGRRELFADRIGSSASGGSICCSTMPAVLPRACPWKS